MCEWKDMILAMMFLLKSMCYPSLSDMMFAATMFFFIDSNYLEFRVNCSVLYSFQQTTELLMNTYQLLLKPEK